ncbi:GNAT family N-acetyltransferase [Skermanella mucosa]|uniref:GNAT family N-acetyltransferase n=1 Tax=Skermanella mucosa TaxID=1789672 RepID=UPI00192C335A|nr:GNAT family N-acetyltransferase [Skermanella mucosa]UEM20889.1 GNAT family N-acetyltransferase [Skermanella mucosa]
MSAHWRPMGPADLPTVERIAEIVHPGYPESPEVPAERLALFPAGCLIARDGHGSVLGYAVSHPGTLGRPPALDSLLGGLPPDADCLYLHDVALLPEARGLGLGESLVDILRDLARRRGLPALALTAVNRSAPYWRRRGFSDHPGDAALAAKLASYGDDAAYMVITLDRSVQSA